MESLMESDDMTCYIDGKDWTCREDGTWAVNNKCNKKDTKGNEKGECEQDCTDPTSEVLFPVKEDGRWMMGNEDGSQFFM